MRRVTGMGLGALMLAACSGGGGEGDDEGASTSGATAMTATTGESASTATTGVTTSDATASSEATTATTTGGTTTATTATTGMTGMTTQGETDTATTGDPPDPPPALCDPPAVLMDIAQGAQVVGDGTPASCTGAALAAAVAQGGPIVFACGDAPATITVDAALPITSDTIVDGDGKITLAGAGADRIFSVDTGNFEATSPRLTLQRIHLRGGRSSGTAIPLGVDIDGGGGAVYLRGGSLTVIDSVFTDNACPAEGPDVAGGAIYGIGLGEVVVVGSTFTNNRCANGGAIGGLGSALTIVNSTLSDNEATGYGANYVENNVQMGRGGNGGAISMDGKGRELTICGSQITGNVSGAFGGAVFRTSYESEPTVIDRSLFADNQAKDRMDDLPSGAGGLYLQGTAVTMTATTIAGNRSRSSAGLWILGHGPAQGVADLTNVTIAGNSTWPRDDFTTRGIGGGLVIGDNTVGTLLNCTIAGNEAQFASGIARASPLTIRNTVVSNLADNQYTPLNCTGTSYAMPPASGEDNLQWPNGLKDDMDCTPGIERADPLLGALGDHGGPTPTMLPEPASPAIAAGSGCPPFDQRGMPRGEPCTVGAVEAP